MQAILNTPQLCFGQVRHRRLRPSANAFDYGVYYLRLPLRAMAAATANDGRKSDLATATATRRSSNAAAGAASIFASRLLSHNRFNLLSFHEKDHGDGRQSPLQWIEDVLQKEGIADADGEIWLQAFPRVLGYVFNPVSFWFCHRRDGALRAVLCEVRNTFGERHCYLLDDGGIMNYGADISARKIFHVSPFCAVEGEYRFRFMCSSHAAGERGSEHTVARIDYHDATGPLLLTSISGISHAVSDTVVARAFFLYPLMSFGVIAKIHWQALRLWLKRVPFFSKPSPPSSELSR